MNEKKKNEKKHLIGSYYFTHSKTELMSFTKYMVMENASITIKNTGVKNFYIMTFWRIHIHQMLALKTTYLVFKKIINNTDILNEIKHMNHTKTKLKKYRILLLTYIHICHTIA